MDRSQLLLDLFDAYYAARKNKRNTVNQLRFELNYERELIALREEIENRTYEIRPGICFIIDKPVKREVMAADFRDRVVHHLLYDYINPAFEKLFIEDSYSCRKGKGTLYGVKRLETFIKLCSHNYTRDCYILKLDIKGYFMSIDKDILARNVYSVLAKAPIERENKAPLDREMIAYLLDKIIYNDPVRNCIIKGQPSDWDGLPPSKSLFHSAPNCGLPIGNLTSQLFNNVYLHPFDVYMKKGFNFWERLSNRTARMSAIVRNAILSIV